MDKKIFNISLNPKETNDMSVLVKSPKILRLAYGVFFIILFYLLKFKKPLSSPFFTIIFSLLVASSLFVIFSKNQKMYKISKKILISLYIVLVTVIFGTILFIFLALSGIIK